MFQSIFLWFTAPEPYLGVIERELSLFGVQYRQLHAVGLAGAGVRLSNSLWPNGLFFSFLSLGELATGRLRKGVRVFRLPDDDLHEVLPPWEAQNPADSCGGIALLQGHVEAGLVLVQFPVPPAVWKRDAYLLKFVLVLNGAGRVCVLRRHDQAAVASALAADISWAGCLHTRALCSDVVSKRGTFVEGKYLYL